MVDDDKTLQKRVKGVDDGDATPRKRVKSVFVDDDVVDSFVRLILGGFWDESLVLLSKIGGTEINSESLVILEQKYLGFLGEDEYLNALDTLKREIAPLIVHNQAKGEDLGYCLAFRVQDSHVKASSKYSKLEDRKKTLDELFKLLDIPERRRLVDAFHEIAPTQRLQVLEEHKDKISCLRFSHSGKYLASSSADCVVIVWEVMLDGHVSLKHILPGHQNPVTCISWSPNDDQLLTCGVEEVVRLWDVGSGQCARVYEKSGAGLVSCAWSPDEKYIFYGINDKSVCAWDPEKGNELGCWKDSIAGGIFDLGISCNEKLEIIVTSACEENMINLFRWESKSEKLIEENQTINSFSLSEDGKFLLVSLLNREIHLWKIDGFVRLLAKYKGQCRRSVSRSCTGGMEHAFIASGCEDSRVYIWHRLSGELVSKLEGHSGAVNCVSWNPQRTHTCSPQGAISYHMHLGMRIELISR